MYTASVTVVAWCTALSAQSVEWKELARNPIFGEARNDGPKAYYPSVLFDKHGFAAGRDRRGRFNYRMWYGTADGQTGIAVSNNGLRWRDEGIVLPQGYHATVKYFRRGFSGVDSGEQPSADRMHYRVWYWDPTLLYTVAAMRYAESPDGVSWHNDQPVQNGAVEIVTGELPDWNRGTYGPCDIIYNPRADAPFVLYYNGTTGGDEAIGLAHSPDGITWTGYDSDGDGAADPVFSGTYTAGDWDFDYVGRATVVRTGRRQYEMWYSGGDGALNQGIGYAVSRDGRNWVREAGNPIFHVDDGVGWRTERSYTPAVLPWKRNSYKMWFAGRSDGETSIGYAVGGRRRSPSRLAAGPRGDDLPDVDRASRLVVSTHPNPANPETAIRIRLSVASRVEVDLFDALGRRVRTLFEGSMQPGGHNFVWDGRDDRGRDVGSGVYFYRALAGRVRETGQITLLR